MRLKRILSVAPVIIAVLLSLFAGAACGSDEGGGGSAELLTDAQVELITVQAAIQACLAEANASQFDDAAGYIWSGDLAGSPKAKGSHSETTSVYSMMRTHELRAAYTINAVGDVTNGDPTITGGWGTKIQWNATTDKWEETP